MAGGAHPLVEQVLGGGNRQLQELAADGLLPLPPEQLIPLQVHLAEGDDADLARRAVDGLRQIEPRMAAPFLERDASPAVLAFFANRVRHPMVIETIIRRRDVPREILVDLARHLPGDLQEILLLRQDAILDAPSILAALEENPQVTPYAQRRVAEYREHLLPKAPRPASPAAIEELPEEEFQAALEEVRRLPVEGEVEERTGLSEGQIRMLPVPARVRLSRGASRLMRSLLLRDSNVQVALSVLNNNAFSDQEIELIARSRLVIEEVLEAIARRREWVGKYPVAKALVQNPRTPVAISLRLLTRLSVRDMRETSRDRNVPDAVRSNAHRLYTIKQK